MFNHSCGLCREKKLRCDGILPCINCQNKGTVKQCCPVMRKPRTRKHSSAEFMTSSQSKLHILQSALLLQDGESLPAPLVNATSPISMLPPPENETFLKQARDALDNLSVCEDLVKYVFYWKVSSMAHGSVHLPTILHLLRRIFDTNSGGQQEEVNDDEITMCMMVIALGLQYMTKQWTPVDLLKRIEKMGETDMAPRTRQRLLWTSSVEYAHSRLTFGVPTFEQIQTIILLLIFDNDDDTTREQFFDHAVRSAQRLGMHHIETTSNKENIDDGLSQELKVRSWWFLVCHSWFSSLSLSTYSILPSHFSTRLPIEREEFDKQPDMTIPSNAIYRPIRYSFTIIKLADMVRRLVDLRLQGATTSNDNFNDAVEHEFESFVQDLPSQYSLDNASDLNRKGPHSVAGSGRPSVERWILHQQLFHAYLEFQQFDRNQPVSFSCRFLANHILDIQQQIETYCCIINHLRVNVTNVVKAAFVLIFDLMQSPNRNQMTRSITTGKIRDALRRCKTSKLTTKIDFDIVFNLLTLEEQKWNTTKKSVVEIQLDLGKGHEMVDFIVPSLPDLTFEENIDAIHANHAVSAWEDEASDGLSTMMPSDEGLFPLLLQTTFPMEENTEWQQLYRTLFM